MPAAEPFDALVLFGISGDLAKKKLFPSLYHLQVRGQLPVPVIGFASSPWNDEMLRSRAHESLEATGWTLKREAVDALCEKLTFVQGDYRDHASFEPLKAALETAQCKRPLFYLAIPPSIFDDVVSALATVGLNETGGVVVEKPFGRDLPSAIELNDILSRGFPEDRTFRIDHYLGKEAIQDLLVFRFANSIFEPIWNRRYVSSVQLTMSEDIGVTDRGSFYDSVGTLRDVFQNHALQILCLIAMEPPIGIGADALRDEQLKILKAMKPVDPLKVIRGQYRGYRQERGVDPDSDTETFFMLQVEIESWRWAGIPFFVRAGKQLACTSTEVVIRFTHPPRLLFAEPDTPTPERNQLIFHLREPGGVTIGVQAKKPGEKFVSQSVHLDVDFAKTLGEESDAYERLLYDALNRNQALFGRQDNVEHQWRIVEPILERPQRTHLYDPGSWGPEESFYPLADYAGWHDPRDD